jgi:hypothetical protein
MKDPFSYSARWDSIGLDCSNCKNFVGPEKWPDINRNSRCSFHKVSLEIELGDNCYKEGEWFCKNFENENAFPLAILELESVRAELMSKILYRAYGHAGQLIEHNIEELRK